MKAHVHLDSLRRPSDPGPLSRSSSVSTNDLTLSPSTSSRFAMFSPVPGAHPPPAYLSTIDATDLAQDHLYPADQFTNPRNGDYSAKASLRPDGPAFDDGALALLNTFWDQLLFSFLAAARSRSLQSVRPAVQQVLRGRLARDAVASADREVEGLIHSEDDQSDKDDLEEDSDQDLTWDLEATWRFTRLKIMSQCIYSDVDLEDEDDMNEQMQYEVADPNSSIKFHAVSWTANVFLTSVIEFLVEHCVISVAKTAHDRIAPRPIDEAATDSEQTPEAPERVLVKPADVERLGLNSSIGRLWRTWRKGSRGFRPGGQSISLTASPRSSRSAQHSLSNISDSPATEGLRTFLANPYRTKERRDAEGVAEIAPQNRALAHEAALGDLNRHGVLQRSKSGARFPVSVSGLSILDYASGRTVAHPRELTQSRPRSSSLPAPEKKRLSAPTVIEDQGAPRSVLTEKRPDADKQDSSASGTESRTGEVPGEHGQPKNAETGVAAAHHRPEREGGSTEIESSTTSESASGVSEEQSESTHAFERQEADRRPPSEYDPFRFDQSDLGSAPASHVVSQTKPAAESENKQESHSAALDGEQRLTPMLEGAVAGSAILGTTQGRKSKRPEPLQVSTNSRQLTDPKSLGFPEADRPKVPPMTRQSEERNREGSGHRETVKRPSHSTKTVSPDEMAFARDIQSGTGAHNRTSPLYEKRKNTDESSSAYATPQGSPGDNTMEKRSMEDKNRANRAAQASSRSNAIARALRSDSKDNKHGKTSVDSAEGTPRADSPSARSEKEFTTLVSSDETLKRSLTPQSLRDLEEPASPHPQQEAFVDAKRSRGPSNLSKPTEVGGMEKRLQQIDTAGAESPRRVVPKSPRQPPTPPLKASKYGLTARDARNQTDSTRDFADFIRSTAPGDEAAGQPAPLRPQERPTAATALSSNRTAAASTANASRRTAQAPAPVKVSAPPSSRANNTKANKILYQPREAKMERQHNQDLINFLNEGPPGASVEPPKPTDGFASRSTVDRFTSANRSSSQTSQSFAESINSRSGLLAKRNNAAVKTEPRSAPSTGEVSPAMVNAKNVGGSGGPDRKQRRIKDPYAISDDEEEDNDKVGDLQPREEGGESLVDFLRNTEPPPLKQSEAPRSTPSYGTSASATGSPSHRPLSPQGQGKAGRGGVWSGTGGVSPHDALPDFLKESRTDTSSLTSSDGDRSAPKNRGGVSRGASRSNGKGIKGMFKRIGVNG